METFRNMLIQYKDVQDIVMILAAVGALAILYIIIKIIWMICSGGVKLEATLTDRKQNKKLREQEKRIEQLSNEVTKLQGINSEMNELKKKLES